ncbi:hypothetical protein Tco_1232752 [Tanacetum coccineum]
MGPHHAPPCPPTSSRPSATSPTPRHSAPQDPVDVNTDCKLKISLGLHPQDEEFKKIVEERNALFLKSYTQEGKENVAGGGNDDGNDDDKDDGKEDGNDEMETPKEDMTLNLGNKEK